MKSFMACFDKAEKGCAVLMFANRDAFRKLTFFESTQSTMAKYGPKSFHSYISVKDCSAPMLFLKPRVFRDSWIFLERVSILADEDLVIDQDLSKLKADREVFPGGVEEQVSFIATDAQIASLRKALAASKVNVRFTGQKGYVSLDAKTIEDFKAGLARTLVVFDKMKAVSESRHFECS